MILKMKNFNIFGVHWKIRLFFYLPGGGGCLGSQKTNIEGGHCLKRGAWTVCQFKGGLARVGWCFWGGGLIPQCTLWINHMIWWKQTYLFFAYFLEYLILVLDDNMDAENEIFSKSKKFRLWTLLSFYLIFCQFRPGVAYKTVAYKKARILK